MTQCSGFIGGHSFTFLAGTILLLACFAITVYSIARVIYRVFFHPLRRYPGPLTHKISRIPYIWATLNGYLHEHVRKLHDEYGDVVRVAPNELSYTNPNAWSDIYGHRAPGVAEMIKYEKFYDPNQKRNQFIINADREEHGRQRRLLSNGFSDKAIRDQEPLIKQYVDLLIRRLHEKCSNGSKALDIVLWYNWTTFDAIGDLAFGEPFGCLHRSDYHPWISMLYSSIKAGAIFQASAHYPMVKRIMVAMIPKSLLAKRNAHWQLVREKVARRMNIKEDRPDFFASILQKKDEMGMTIPQLVGNASVLIMAGSETTATLLSGVTYLLLLNDHAMKKLENEVRHTFQSESEINVASVSKLSYMLACLNEALRMYPPTPTGFPRVVPKGGGFIADRFVPEGTVVAISHWAINHKRSNFTRPWTYMPERFLTEANQTQDKREAFQPFSAGPRNCIGRNLAYAEMRLILARVIFNFNMKIAEESKDWVAQQKVYTLWEKKPLLVHLIPRQ